MCLTAGLAGCASHRGLRPAGEYTAVPAPVASPAPAAAPVDYRINPLDELRIDVFGEPELSFKELPVNVNGTIVMPMIGVVEAQGKTTRELADRIAAALDHYLRRPQVAVNITQFTSQKVTVEGAVNKPGMFQSAGRVTLLDAVAMAEGTNDYAKVGEIVVFRRIGDQRYVARFDLGAIQNGTASDPAIQSGDVVVVGYSNARRLFRDTIAVLPAAVGIFVALIK